MYSLGDLRILIRSTLSEYGRAAQVAGAGFLKNWWLPVVHAVVGALFVFVAGVVVSIFGIVGGFIIGLLGAYLLAAFLGTVEAGVEKESVRLREIPSRGAQIFSPLLNVLFLLFLLFFVANNLLPPKMQFWILAAMNLVVVTVFNPIPEAVYLERRSGFDVFASTFEFMRENTVEWLFPFVALMVLMISAQGGGTEEFLQFFISGGPFASVLHFGTNVATVMNIWLLGPIAGGGVPILILTLVQQYVFFAVVYFVFIFRGALYKRLSTSGRRKRIYQYRAGI